MGEDVVREKRASELGLLRREVGVVDDKNIMFGEIRDELVSEDMAEFVLLFIDFAIDLFDE